MKKFDRLKTIQLVVFVVLTIICGVTLFANKTVFHMAAFDSSVRFLCIMLWLSLGASFLFIYIDFAHFSSLKQDYRELDFAVHSDHVSGIANRFSSDLLIEKYLDKPLPPEIGCVMVELSNVKEVNKMYGHLQGNELIKDFALILRISSVDLCFVARNGGNKFLAIFEHATDEKIQKFLDRVNQKIRANNANPESMHIQCEYGVAFNEGDSVKTITELIALSNSRIRSTDNQ